MLFRSWLCAVCLVAVTLNIAEIVHGQNMTQEERKALIDYCFQNAGRQNPIDDLIDKGFLPPGFKGETCKSIKEAYEHEQIIIKGNQLLQQEAINKQNQANIDRYHACLQNKTNEACEDILDNNNTDSFVTYNECIQNRSTTWEECQKIIMSNMSAP